MLWGQSGIQQSFLPPWLCIQLHSSQTCRPGKIRKRQGKQWGIWMESTIFLIGPTLSTVWPCGVSTRTNPLPSVLLVRQKCWCAHFTYSTLQCPAWTDALEKHPLGFVHPLYTESSDNPLFVDSPPLFVLTTVTWCAQPLYRVGRGGEMWVFFGKVLVLGLCVLPCSHPSDIDILFLAAQEEFEGCQCSIGHNLGIP